MFKRYPARSTVHRSFNLVRTAPGVQRDRHTVLSRWQTQAEAETALVELADEFANDDISPVWRNDNPLFFIQEGHIYRVFDVSHI